LKQRRFRLLTVLLFLPLTFIVGAFTGIVLSTKKATPPVSMVQVEITYGDGVGAISDTETLTRGTTYTWESEMSLYPGITFTNAACSDTLGIATFNINGPQNGGNSALQECWSTPFTPTKTMSDTLSFTSPGPTIQHGYAILRKLKA